jgi:hypothetical protein
LGSGTAGPYTIGQPVGVTVGNVPATRRDIQINVNASFPVGADLSDFAPLIQVGGGDRPKVTDAATRYGGQVGVHNGNVGRWYVADVHGKNVNVLVEAPANEFDSFAKQAEALLATVVF